MKRCNLFIVVSLLLLSACTNNKYEPQRYLSRQQEDSLIYKVIRYAAKLPANANHDTKFDTKFDPYYKALAAEYDIRAYYIDEDSTHYFVMTRPARSITPMRESIGCKLRYNNDGTISEYEEVFRTWKMPEDKMNERFPVLFDRMVKGESLEPYYSKTKGDQYIEFPDDRFYFDKADRKWHDRVMDSLK